MFSEITSQIPIISGYFFLFVLMLIEGPIATYIGAFSASQGIFNIYMVFFLAILGNVIPDTIFYLIGRYSRTNFVEKILKKFNFTKEKIANLEITLHNHLGKSLTVFKLTPGLAPPGLIITGFAKIDFKKFFIYTTTFNVIAAIIFTYLGFYSGIATEKILEWLKLEQYILLIFIILLIIVYFIIKQINKISNKL